MKNTKPITAEEYKAAIEWINFIVGNSGVRTPNPGNQLVARVLLALDGAWREVPENLESRDWADQERERIVIINTGKSAIAASHGLPVDHIADASKLVEPCPECGGSKRIVSQIEIEPILTDAGCIGAKRTPTFVPCPTCQGGR